MSLSHSLSCCFSLYICIYKYIYIHVYKWALSEIPDSLALRKSITSNDFRYHVSYPIPSCVLQYVSLNTWRNQHLKTARATVPHIVHIKLEIAIQKTTLLFVFQEALAQIGFYGHAQEQTHKIPLLKSMFLNVFAYGHMWHPRQKHRVCFEMQGCP